MLNRIKKFFEKKIYVVTGYKRRSTDWDIGETWIDSVWLNRKVVEEYMKEIHSQWRDAEYKLHILTMNKKISFAPLTTDKNRGQSDELCRLLGLLNDD